MKVILLSGVKNLGSQGDVVEVNEGYARNFLFPQHLAVEASDKALHEKKEREDASARREKKEERAQRELAAEIDGQEVVIMAKASEGSLYAAITAKDVAAGLKELGHKVKADYITFDSVKELGSFEADIHFPSGFDASVRVVIEEK